MQYNSKKHTKNWNKEGVVNMESNMTTLLDIIIVIGACLAAIGAIILGKVLYEILRR
jgi:uridine phosphorylase